MHKPINITYLTFLCGCFLLIVISIIFSCNQNVPKPQDRGKKEITLKPPVTIAGKPPVITLLDTCPSPKTIQLGPPEKKSASFFVSMQNFTTKNGLAHNAVGKSCKDKNSNLWFCTY